MRIVLRHPCVDGADSVKNLTFLGMMAGTKDTYVAMKTAFELLFSAISKWNAMKVYVDIP